MNKNLVIGAIVALIGAVVLSGCLTSRSIRSFDDHQYSDVTIMETIDLYTYFPFVVYQVRHQFWQCNDSGEGLVCAKACDGDTDLHCPMVIGYGGMGTGTNIR